MEEGKGVAMAILGMVAVISVVGLVLLFNGATANVVTPGGAKVYGGGEIAHGLDQYQDPGSYVRYSTPRPLEFEEGIDPARNREGAEWPDVVLDSNYRRTGPIEEYVAGGATTCHYPPYSDRLTELYAKGDCIPLGYNPNTEEQEEPIAPGYESYACCDAGGI